jgi:trichothecene 3-O-acetyltransferase
MSRPTTVEDFSVCLDIIGQQPGLNMYTQLCLCFSVPDICSQSAIIETLKHGLERLSASFPWAAGQVVNEGSSKLNSGIFNIKSLDDIPQFTVKDLTGDASVPTMQTMKGASFPFTMLDESIFAPRTTVPGSHNETVSASTPVFLLQATFIAGGLVLTFLGQHQVMDIAGLGQVMYLFSKACRNEDFTREELLSGNLPRHNIIPLLEDSYKPGPELDDQIVKEGPLQQSVEKTSSRPAPSPPEKDCAYFTFTPTSLGELKGLATNSIPNSSEYISTDDALSAFIWQSLSRVRLSRLQPTDSTAFARAVDVRRLFNIPKTYPGIIHNMTYHRYTLQKIVEEPLGVVASQLRWAIDPKTTELEFTTRALATFLERSPDKSSVSFLARFNTSSDIMLSSWARENCYSLDFGLGLGKPEAVRRPRFSPNRTLVYFMPMALDGEIAVGIFTRKEDMERLREDDQFMKFATYIG